MSCAGLNARGEPCRSPVVGSRPFCFSHDPTRREAYLASRRRGGVVTSSKHRRYGLTPNELGELHTHEDAERQLALISGAVATRRMDRADGDACTRAIGQWLKARSDKLRLVELERLKAAVDQMEAENKQLRRENERLASLVPSVRLAP